MEKPTSDEGRLFWACALGIKACRRWAAKRTAIVSSSTLVAFVELISGSYLAKQWKDTNLPYELATATNWLAAASQFCLLVNSRDSTLGGWALPLLIGHHAAT